MTWSVRGTGGRSENEHTCTQSIFVVCCLFVAVMRERKERVWQGKREHHTVWEFGGLSED